MYTLILIPENFTGDRFFMFHQDVTEIPEGCVTYTADIEPDIYKLFKPAGSKKIYSIRSINHKMKWAKIEELKRFKEVEEEYGCSLITCPYCGHEDQDSWEGLDADDKVECGQCGSTYSYERIVTATYNSWPVKMNEVETIIWNQQKKNN